MKYETIILSEYINPILKELEETKVNVQKVKKEISQQNKDIDDLINRLNKLSNQLDSDTKIDVESKEEAVNTLNLTILEKLDNLSDYKDTPLTQEDILIGSISGIVGVMLDIFMVGTPNIDKIYQGDEVFNGSKLTEMIRNLSDTAMSPFLQTLESKFSVPYDLSKSDDGLIPNNHRLKSLSHDPFFGLFFSLFDFVFKTTTYINNQGKLSIKLNTTKSYEPIKLYQSIYYFMGHILSDFSTARGIPIPGFFLTQVFTEENFNSNISKSAEQMYKDGYDLRHLSSMLLAHKVKKMIVDIYLDLTNDLLEESPTNSYSKESNQLKNTIKREKINMIADSISITGNVVKFFAPPNMGNPAALNIVEWYKFLITSATNIKIITRDKGVEQVDYNRETIDENWRKLMK